MKDSHQLLFGICLSLDTIIVNFMLHFPSSFVFKKIQIFNCSPIKNTFTDSIEEEESDDPNYLFYGPQARAAPQVGGTFANTEPNIRRSAKTFKMIREIGGVECTKDVYAQLPS